MKRHRIGLLAGIILVIAIALSWWLLRSAPGQEREKPQRSAKIVQTIAPVARDHAIAVSAYGSVIPARRITVRPEVGGRIVSQHPSLVPGGRVAVGETLLTIDDADYALALREANTALQEARSEIDIEAGRLIVAERELEELRKVIPAADINEALVLRKPFQARTQAGLERAAAAVELAELNLTRTVVKAPFNALVIEESAEAGQLADPGTSLATLVGADAFWIQTSVPLSDLRWIRLPADDKPGATASVGLSGTDLTWNGKVTRLLGNLEEAGRLARLLVEVPSPLDANPTQALLLGSYVRVEIEAGTLENAIEIPQTALREGNRLWLAGPENTLVVREVEILWKTDNSVFIPDIFEPGESLIVSDLRTPLPGMAISPEPLRTGQ